MRKSNLIKVISILVVSLMVMLFSTNVMAAETDNGFTDLTPSVGNNTTNGTSNANSNTANSNTNSTNNTNRNNTSNNTNSTNNTNNSSIYNNTNSLPKTGVTDSIPVAVLLIVFAISAVYAYKKIKDYRNI